jgi:hypothetical protein
MTEKAGLNGNIGLEEKLSMTYENNNDLDWISIMKAFLPKDLAILARQKYTELLTLDEKERLRLAIRNVERNYVPYIDQNSFEVDIDGELKPIGMREAMRRRSNCVQMQVLDAVRRELNIK